MSSNNYVCIHISGSDNVWSYLLTHWTVPRTISLLVSIPPLPTSFAKDFSWPSVASISSSQETHASSCPFTAIRFDDLCHLSSPGPIWIPSVDSNLQLRLIVIVFFGAAGHRGRATTARALIDNFCWATLEHDVRLFHSSIIYFLSTKG